MKMRLLCSLVLGAAALPGLAPTTATAQTPDSLRAHYMIDLPPTLEILSTVGRTSPGTSSGSPTGFGANWGDGFVGASYQGRVRFSELNDGAVVAGIGLGNSRDLIGGEVAITSFSTLRSDPFQVVSVSLKLHRAFLDNYGLAVGWESAFFLTSNEGDGGSSLYVAASKVWPQVWWQPFTKITTTVGLGDGRFRSEEEVRVDKETVKPFGSIGVQLWEPMSFIADWTGQDLTLAMSIVPTQRFPLVITPGVTDVTGTAGDGARFIISAGTGFDFARLPRLFP